MRAPAGRWRWSWRTAVCGGAVLLLGAVVVVAFAALAQAGAGLRDDGHLINVAGRQRMLSQQVSIAVTAVLDADGAATRATARTRLTGVVGEMRSAHDGLLHGDPALGLVAPPEELRAWQAAGGAQLDRQLAQFWAQAELVAASEENTDAVTAAAASVQQEAAGPLLARLDAAVTTYDRGSTARLDEFHRLVGLTGAAVVGAGVLVALVVGRILTRDRRRLLASRTAARTAAAELEVRKRFDDAVMDALPTGVLVADAAGNVVVRNAAHRRMVDDLAGTSPLSRALAGETLHDVALHVDTPGGEPRHLLVSAEPVTGGDGTTLGAVAVATDITRERRVQAELQEAAAFQEAVLTASPDVVYVTDLTTGVHRWASRAVEEMLGYDPAELATLGDALYARIVHPDDVGALVAGNAAAAALPDGEVFSQRYRVRHADGAYRVLSRRLTPFHRTADGTVDEILGVARDVTATAAAEDALRHAALHDVLTGLPNRKHLLEVLTASLAAGRGPVAVLFCDLDGFKAVNDAAGHSAGDAVLVATAARLSAAVRPVDLVARVGGDEFVLLLAPDPERDPSRDALRVADRITLVLAEAVDVGGSTHRVTVSTGITLAEPGADPATVLTAADTAMYRAKGLGKNQHQLAAEPRHETG